MDREEFTDKERHALAIEAVNRLIADVEARRLPENKEFAEVIAVCVRETLPSHLRTLKWLLEQKCQLYWCCVRLDWHRPW